MGEDNLYQTKVQLAYDAVKDLAADEAFKLAGFKAVLASLLGTAVIQPAAQHQYQGQVTKQATNPMSSSGWESTIADKLAISPEQVTSIFHMDSDVLMVIVDHKKLPKSLSQSTQHLAALLAAGRQALKLDDGKTDYDMIRNVCTEYGVYNSKNFTSYIKLLGNRFIYSGSGQSQSISLTLPAFSIVSEIAKRYVDGAA